MNITVDWEAWEDLDYWDGSDLVLADCKKFKVFYVNSYKYIIFDNITVIHKCVIVIYVHQFGLGLYVEVLAQHLASMFSSNMGD